MLPPRREERRTDLKKGFGGEFWDAYHALIPKAPGFEERKQLYLLYHYLNHYNLFGSGYYGQCESILRRLGG